MIKYLYICSAGHSGSTLLDLLMGSHPKVASLGEISYLPKNIALNSSCTCGQPVRSCKFWQEVINKLSNELSVDIWKNPYALNLGFINPAVEIDKDYQTPRYLLHMKLMHGLWFAMLRYGTIISSAVLKTVSKSITNNFLLYDTVRTLLQVDIAVDSSKHYLKGIQVYKTNPDEVRLIFLTRDGRAILYSGIKRNKIINNQVIGWKKYYTRAFSLRERHVNKEHWIQIKYEDLAADPKQELIKLCKFAGLDFDDNMLTFASKIHHSTNGNRMRFSKSSKIKPDNAWREHLSDSTLNYFESIAGNLNKRLGYE
ncbi:MAG: sulfotransferase [Desulfobacteraceae bacterium]|nr:MAG: sulfotransferase [Desulfobacteraceae bacterium]